MRTADPRLAAERRRQILEAAARCFARHGFQGATMARICAEAGMGAGHVYHYFTGKEAIVEAIIAEDLSQRLRVLDDLGRASPGLPAALVRAATDGVRDGFPGIGRAIHAEVLAVAARNPRLAEALRRQEHDVRTALAGYLRRDQERGAVDPDLAPEVAAYLLLALGRGLSLGHADPPEEAALARGLERLVRGFLAAAPGADRSGPG